MKKKKVGFFAKLFDPRMWLFDFVKFTGAIPVIVDLRLKRIYENGKKPKGIYKGKYIVSANHSSTIDPVILFMTYWMRRLCCIATKEIFEIKFWGKFFLGCGCIPIDRENVSMKTFKTINRQIDHGHCVAVFPEGHINKEDNIGSFKSGIVMMAMMAKADIVPTYIAKRESRFNRQCVVIGNKIKLSDYITSPIPSIQEVDNLAKVLMEKEIELEKLYKSSLNKKGKNNE